MFILDLDNMKIVKQVSILNQYKNKIENKAFIIDNLDFIERCLNYAAFHFELHNASEFDAVEDLVNGYDTRTNDRLREYEELGFI